MGAAPVVRGFLPADAAACAAIYAPFVAHTTVSLEIDPPDAAEIARRFAALQDAGYPVLVADAAGRIGGFAYAGAFRPRPGYRQTVEHSLYVDSDAQRAGIGAALLAAVVEACRARGFRRMVGVISDPGRSHSLGFHLGRGFALAGTLHGVGHKFGRDLDVVLVERALDRES